MRVHQISCPECGSGLKSKAGIPVGQRIPCPKCKRKFTVEAPDEADIVDDAKVLDEDEVIEDFEVDEPAPKKKSPPPAPRSSGKNKPATRDLEDDETEEEEVPRSKKKPAGGNAKRSRRDDDDDTEERPIKKKKKKKKRQDDDDEENFFVKLKSNIFVRIITLVVLFGILAVAAYLLYKKKTDEAKDTSTLPPQSIQVVDVRV